MSVSDVQKESDWSLLNLNGHFDAFCDTLALLQQRAGLEATVLLRGKASTRTSVKPKPAGCRQRCPPRRCPCCCAPVKLR